MNLGHHFACISKYAYLIPEIAETHYADLGYYNVKFISQNNTQAYVMEDADKIVVATRGTETREAADIWSDMKAYQTKSKTRGGVHCGFYDDANEIHNDVALYISAQERRDKKVWFCGHSLGGALAQVLASRFPSRTACCYTYGGPRVGNKKWAKHQRYSCHRFVNNNDIVPRVPPFWTFYMHYGALHYINYYGNIRNMTPWQRFKDRLRGIRRAWQKGEPFDSLRDHGIDYYVKYLKEM